MGSTSVNRVGNGTESPESASVTPSTTPAAPGTPTLTGGDQQVALTWTAGSDGGSAITGWKYLKKEGNTWDSDWTTIQNSGASTTTHTVTGLTNGTEYKFKVRAVNANGDGAESPESAAVTPSTTPPAPNKPTVAARHQAVVLGWSSTGNGGSAITGWKFLKKEGNNWDANWTEVPNSGANTTSYTVTGLTNATTYRFKVRAVNGNGDGTESSASDPATPGSTSLSAENVAGATATLKLSGHTGTWSLKGRQSGATCQASLTGTTRDLSGLDMDTAYTYDAYGTADCSGAVLASVVFTTATTPAAPSQPTVSGGDRQVTLTWTAGGNGGSAITGWKVLKHDGSAWEGTWTPIPNSGANTARHTVTGLTNGTEYKFKVRAVNTNGDGAESPESDAVTPAAGQRSSGAVGGSGGAETQAEVPPSPSRPAVAAHGGGVTLTWSSRGDGGSRITRWQYSWKTDGDYGPWTDIPDSGANTTRFTVTGLANGRNYRFRVRAVNAVGPGRPSVESAPAMPGDAPFAASKPAATAGYEQVTLVWASGGDGGIPIAKWQYRMRAAAAAETAASHWSDVPGSGPWTTHTTVTGLTNGTAYRFQVRAVNAAGPGSTSPWSDAVTPVDAAPDFGDARIPDQRYERGVPIAPLPLPAATGGDGALTYALAPALPAGLVFDAATRTVTGTPTDIAEAATWNWTATDSDPTDPDTASLSFLIEVAVPVADQAIMEDTLAAQGRAMLTNATGAIGERFRRGNAVAGAGDALRSAGRSVEATLWSAALAEVRSSGRGPGAVSLEAPGGELSGGGSMEPSGGSGFGVSGRDDLFRERSFALQLGGGEDRPGRWTAWGAGAAQRFDGSSVAGSFDGQVDSVFGGLDVRLGGNWLAGAAVSRSWGASDYDATGMGGSRGRLTTALNGIHPYLRRESPGGLEVWAIGGYGRGTAEDLRDGSTAEESGLEMRMGAAGLRRRMADLGGVELSVVGGAGYLLLITEDGRRAVDGVMAEAFSGRLGLEASRAIGALAPYVRVGGRFDGGDVATGAGLEVTAGMRYGGERLDFEAQGRWLAAHAASGYQEYGGMARLAWRARPDGGGLRVHLAPRWGAPGSGDALLGGGEHLLGGDGRLLGAGATAGMPPVGGAGGWDPRDRSVSLRSGVGYGFALRQGVLVPAVAYDQGGYGGPRARFGFAYEARGAAGRDGLAPVVAPRWGLVAGWEPATAATASDYRMEVRYSRPF